MKRQGEETLDPNHPPSKQMKFEDFPDDDGESEDNLYAPIAERRWTFPSHQIPSHRMHCYP